MTNWNIEFLVLNTCWQQTTLVGQKGETRTPMPLLMRTLNSSCIAIHQSGDLVGWVQQEVILTASSNRFSHVQGDLSMPNWVIKGWVWSTDGSTDGKMRNQLQMKILWERYTNSIQRRKYFHYCSSRIVGFNIHSLFINQNSQRKCINVALTGTTFRNTLLQIEWRCYTQHDIGSEKGIWVGTSSLHVW